VSVVAHIFDVAHDLGIEPVERLLDPAVLRDQDAAIRKLLSDRLALAADGRTLAVESWSPPEPWPSASRYGSKAAPLSRGPPVDHGPTVMFPRSAAPDVHQRYEGEALTSQAILMRPHAVRVFRGTTQGTFAVVQRFVPSGVHHILIGPDHLLFLVACCCSVERFQ
jgi:hypothetical protein